MNDSKPGYEGSPCCAYLRLLRISAVFTALADVSMGFLLVQGSFSPILPFLLLALSSASLYCAGMVLNDVFDADLDLLERPERPIPSGQIDRVKAAWLGAALLVLGAALPWSIGLVVSGNSTVAWQSGTIAQFLLCLSSHTMPI